MRVVSKVSSVHHPPAQRVLAGRAGPRALAVAAALAEAAPLAETGFSRRMVTTTMVSDASTNTSEQTISTSISGLDVFGAAMAGLVSTAL